MSQLKNIFSRKRELMSEKRFILISKSNVSLPVIRYFFMQSIYELERIQSGAKPQENDNSRETPTTNNVKYFTEVVMVEDKADEYKLDLAFQISRLNKDIIKVKIRGDANSESISLQIKSYEESSSNYIPNTENESFFYEVVSYLDNLLELNNNNNSLLLGKIANQNRDIINRNGFLPSERYKLEY